MKLWQYEYVIVALSLSRDTSVELLEEFAKKIDFSCPRAKAFQAGWNALAHYVGDVYETLAKEIRTSG